MNARHRAVAIGSALLLAPLLAVAPAASKPAVIPLTTVPLMIPKESRHMGGGKWRPAECEKTAAWFKSEFKDHQIAFGGKLAAAPQIDAETCVLSVAARNFKAINLTWEVTFTLRLKDPGLIAYAKNLKAGDDLSGQFVVESATCTVTPETSRAKVEFLTIANRVMITIMK